MRRPPDRRPPFEGAWPGLLIVPLAVWVLTVNLGDVPEPWFDEGIHVNAAHTLATAGRYALTDASGVSPYDARVQVGPTVVLPVSASVRLAGPGMAAARAPIALYGAICLALAFLVTWSLSGRHAGAAWLAVSWLAWGSAEPFASVGFVSRNVIGEGPALAFLLAGLALLAPPPADGPPRIGRAFLAGLAWGLAAITKGQLTLLLPVVLAALVVMAFWRLPQERWRVVVLCAGAAVPPATWILWQVGALGLAGFLRQADQLQDGVATQIFASDWDNTRRAAASLWHAGFLVTGVAGLAWAVRCAGRQGRLAFPLLVWSVLCGVLLLWFVVSSVGWARYALYPVALTACLSAAWLGRVARVRPRAGAILIALGFLWGAAAGLAHAQRLLSPHWSGLAEMNQFIERELGRNTRIESWEWQVGLTTPEVFVRPTLTDIYRVTRVVMNGEAPQAPGSRLGEGCADYLLEGPFSGWIGMYGARHEAGLTREEIVLGDYHLFRMPAPESCRMAFQARPGAGPAARAGLP